ncbi:MAG: CHAT domain-containing protein [Pseudomonadales bacterium]|nr:CHAT domain-containing protein [Pseudomonadales bacterium]
MNRLILLLCCFCMATLRADPVRDGSIGPTTTIQPTGPEFLIDASMGARRGPALFHSFSEFSLDRDQTATFTGDTSVDFVISRVSSNTPSLINGKLVSAIPGASFFLLNPNGILISKDAQLDVDGSVFLSSADYLAFDNGEIFTSDFGSLPTIDILTPTSFGFLDAEIGNISLNGTILELPDSTSLSLVGGNINIESASISLTSGEVQLVAVASAIEVPTLATAPPTLGQPGIGSTGQLADIVLLDSTIDVSGDAAGTVRIQAGRLDIQDSNISSVGINATTLAPVAINIIAIDSIKLAGETEISASTEGNATGGDIVIMTDQFKLLDDAEIISDTAGAGAAGSVAIVAGEVLIAGDAEIASDVETGATGNGGAVTITAANILLQGAPEISTDTDPMSSGQGGNIILTAADAIVLDIDFEAGEEAGVLSNTEGSGPAGSIQIQTPLLSIRGGTINAMSDGASLGGSIIVEANDVLLTDHASISVESSGTGDAGDILITGKGSVKLAPTTSISAKATIADGGNLLLTGYSQIISQFADVTANVGAGIGGNINLSATQVVADNAAIIAQAGAGQGGAINIDGDFFFSDSSLVSASAGPAGISGTVAINAPEVDLSASLEALPTAYRDPTNLFRQACAARTGVDATSSFVITEKTLVPSTVEGIPLARVEQIISADLVIARHAAQTKPAQQALDLLLLAQTTLQYAEPNTNTIYGLVHVARSYTLVAKRLETSPRHPLLLNAANLLQRARGLSKAIDNLPIQSYVLGNLADLYAANQQLDEALYLARSASNLAQEAETPASEYRWLALQGQILTAQRRPTEAIDAYRRSISVIENSSQSALVSVDVSGDYFYQQIVPVYHALVALLLDQAKSASSAAAQTMFHEARQVMELFKAAELRDYYQDECVAESQSSIMNLDEVASGVAVIYPIVLANQLELLVGIDGRLQHYSVNVTAKAIADQVAELREILENLEDDYLDISQALYDWVVRPYASALTAVDTLVFVNDGPLRGLSVAALHDGDEFLVQRFALAVAPGLNMVDPKPLPEAPPVVFLAGLSQAVDGFSALPGVPGELNAVASAMSGEVVLNSSFALDQLRLGLVENNPSMVHLATHASFGNDSSASFILTWDGQLSVNKLSEYVLANRFQQRPLDLLVLSACETAVGDSRSALGLAGIAVRAGAKSAMGSLWTISDEATALLMGEFYYNLIHRSLSRSESLRQAQLTLLNDPAFNHPFFWSPFLLINNWL